MSSGGLINIHSRGRAAPVESDSEDLDRKFACYYIRRLPHFHVFIISFHTSISYYFSISISIIIIRAIRGPEAQVQQVH